MSHLLLSCRMYKLVRVNMVLFYCNGLSLFFLTETNLCHAIAFFHHSMVFKKKCWFFYIFFWFYLDIFALWMSFEKKSQKHTWLLCIYSITADNRTHFLNNSNDEASRMWHFDKYKPNDKFECGLFLTQFSSFMKTYRFHSFACFFGLIPKIGHPTEYRLHSRKKMSLLNYIYACSVCGLRRNCQGRAANVERIW